MWVSTYAGCLRSTAIRIDVITPKTIVLPWFNYVTQQSSNKIINTFVRYCYGSYTLKHFYLWFRGFHLMAWNPTIIFHMARKPSFPEMCLMSADQIHLHSKAWNYEACTTANPACLYWGCYYWGNTQIGGCPKLYDPFRRLSRIRCTVCIQISVYINDENV